MFRSEDEVLQEALYFIPTGGACGRGRPRMRFFDTVKADLIERGVVVNARTQTQFWDRVKELAANRGEWRRVTSL